MTDKKTTHADPRYNKILIYEKNTSEEAIDTAIKKPKVSFWMFFFPFVFLPFMWEMDRYKAATYGFREGYTYTKEIALNAAYKVYTKEVSEEKALLETKEIIKTQLNPDVAVSLIFEKQIEEVDLLFHHYLGLLNSSGDNYKQMVINHYKSYDKFVEFLNQLDEAEKEVSKAARSTFRSDVEGLPELIEKLEKAIVKYRLEYAKQVFP